MATAIKQTYGGLSFGPFKLVVNERLLTKEGVPVELGARAYDILVVLTSTPNEIVSKKDLLSRVWPDVIVEEGSLRFHMNGLRKALRTSGRVAFACWREPRENPWMMAPLQAVYQHVPKLPQQGPEDPGPFAFASEERVTRILSEAGFSAIAMEPCNLSLDIAIGRGLDAAVETALQIGPASRALDGHPQEVRAAATRSIRETLTPFLRGDSVPLPASIWIVTARPG